MLADVMRQLEDKYKELQLAEQRLRESSDQLQSHRLSFLEILFSEKFFGNEDFFRAYNVLTKTNLHPKKDILDPLPSHIAVTSAQYYEYGRFQLLAMGSFDNFRGARGGIILRDKNEKDVIYHRSQHLNGSIQLILRTYKLNPHLTLTYYGDQEWKITPLSLQQLSETPENRAEDEFPPFYKMIYWATENALKASSTRVAIVQVREQELTHSSEGLEKQLAKMKTITRE